MKPRKSTAILVGIWIAAFVLYLFVKPSTPDHVSFSPIANTITKSVITPNSER